MIVVKRVVGVVVATLLCCLAVGTTANAAPFQLPPLPRLPQIFAPPVPPQKRLTTSFATLQKSMAKSLPGQIGLAVVPIGADAGMSFGTIKTGRAWSTIKVPVALAAERKNGITVASKEDKAIMFSDNDAAGDLWGSLGGGRASADAVTQVLRQAHDTKTRVASEADKPPSYPGYTHWALADQAAFGAHLPCLVDSEHVIKLMSNVAANQQWGATKIGHGAITAVKGGWGPGSGMSSSNGYFVRQLAVVSTTNGQVALAMAALPKNGSFTTGTQMLNRIGDWLGRNLALLPMGRCLPGQ